MEGFRWALLGVKTPPGPMVFVSVVVAVLLLVFGPSISDRWRKALRTSSEFELFPKCLIIAEIAQTHDGSLGTAHAYIDAVARAGADAIKFQTHIAAAESTPAEPWRVKFSPQDATRFDYWKRLEFTAEQWAGLASHASERGLFFLSSVFSHKR